jgi:plasmid stability protein
MSDVPAIHVRNVPKDIVDRLKRRAKLNGRSLNAEIVDVLGASVEGDREPGWIARRIAEIHERYPRHGEPIDAAELIRQGHEERDRKIIEAAFRRR